jgi:stage III sporulation protein AG
MEERLAGLLSQVEGAGQVKVMIYADSSSEQIPAYNNEQDTRNDQSSNGTSSEISETRELALSGDDTPVILKIIVPQIKGVVVVAEGANDLLIKEQLNTAVCTLLGIPEHRVQILKHK